MIKHSEDKGRGVFGRYTSCYHYCYILIAFGVASRELARGEVIEISPVLLFSAEEYGAHGQYTVLDHYTFKWRDGRMALALGLGASILL